MLLYEWGAMFTALWKIYAPWLHKGTVGVYLKASLVFVKVCQLSGSDMLDFLFGDVQI